MMGMVWWVVVPEAWAAGRKEPFTVTFHVQGDVNEGGFVQEDPSLGAGIYFRKVPVVTHQQMRAFTPFLSADGVTYGAVFELNDVGAQRLATLQLTEQGKLLRAVVNGQPVDTLRVDSGGETGSIVIWRGLDEKMLKLFEKKLQRKSMGG